MLVDRILYPITSLGPGKRLCVWTVGCRKKCYMCANPELRAFDKSKEISIEEIQRVILSVPFGGIDGFTISGGEPFCQTKELFELLKFFYGKNEDILVFSGYTYEELQNMKDPYVKYCLEYIGIVITGEYIDEQNDSMTSLVASKNQELHILKPSLMKRYEDYQKRGRMIQNVFYKNEMMSIGIHNREGR